MKILEIEGNRSLTGSIRIAGAKNSAVALIPAAILCDGVVELDNVPDISDIRALIKILKSLGSKVEYITKNELIIDNYDELSPDMYGIEDEAKNMKMPLQIVSYVGDTFVDCANYTGYDLVKKLKKALVSGVLDLDESLNESKQDIERFKQWAGVDLYNRFIKQKPRLEPRKRDIYYWMKNSSKEQLDTTLSELENIPSRRILDKDAKKGAELIYSDNEWDVYKINTYEASVKYGNGTAWCIAGKNNGINFNDAINDVIGEKL